MLDYILTSRRFRSLVRKATVKWGVNTYRHGSKFDHGLVEIKWYFIKERKPKISPQQDYSTLKDNKIKEDYDKEAIKYLKGAPENIKNRYN